MLGNVNGRGKSCDNNINRHERLKGEPNCGGFECRCVTDTAHCIGNGRSTEIPRVETHITKIYAECYDLSNLSRHSFTNIHDLNLREIHLLQNKMHALSSDVFSGFSNLTVLEISKNEGINHTLLYSAFGSIQKRQQLNLTLNKIGLDNVTEEIFQNLNKSNVRFLSLAYNRVIRLNLASLEKLSALKTLLVHTSWITNMTYTGLLQSIQVLDLSESKLYAPAIQLCRGNVSIIPDIRTLLLGNNYIGIQGKGSSPEWGCLKKLEIMDLSHNGIKTLSISLFSNLTSLRALYLHSNWIHKVVIGRFPPYLEILDFSNNELVAFPPLLCEENSIETFPNLRELNFSRNYIQNILTKNWTCLTGIKVLDFSKNDVSSIKNNTFAHLTSLESLYLDNMIPWMKNIEITAFNCSSLHTVSVRYNWIDFTNELLHDMFKWCPNVQYLDISYNYFQGLNESSIAEILSPMSRLETLIAERIGLQKFPATFLTTFKTLRYLNINRNLLITLQFPPSFNNANMNLSIRQISVADGNIKTIEADAFPSSIMHALEELDLSGNQFACDCYMEWFRDAIINGTIGNITLSNWPEKYECRSLYSPHVTLFKDYTPDEKCVHISPLIVAFIAAGSSLFVCSVLSITAYWNKWYLQYWWYRSSRERRHSSRQPDPEQQIMMPQPEYDCFVVYHSEDGHFVHHSFRQLVENKLNFKLHIWEREAASGSKVDVMLDAMYASRQVCVIVSNHLIKDEWCKFQVDVALDRSIQLKRNFVLFVVLDEIDFNDVSKTWCVLLTRTLKAYWSNSDNTNDIKKKLFEQTIQQHIDRP